ncbi:hypothetical protein N657DRAFT_128726 [Parathielavia appendiculata]|uniref:Uncharacterized protein n=1 Tax=Parathielavia appendiculata TaxID=2587402 RepID=A0AAN6Z1H5_9PEZI|nr:hypothetical protein N657DRAFT_128726 [Parathielavia appendiculata]
MGTEIWECWDMMNLGLLFQSGQQVRSGQVRVGFPTVGWLATAGRVASSLHLQGVWGLSFPFDFLGFMGWVFFSRRPMGRGGKVLLMRCVAFFSFPRPQFFPFSVLPVPQLVL